MKMTPAFLIIGGLMVFWASTFIAVILPAVTIHDGPSNIWQARSDIELEGQQEYVNNGCSYCHSQFARTTDWGIGRERVAQQGDYYAMAPVILGTERIGPDLQQEGGEHSDGWHYAHFINPRNTRPMSLMPSWEFLGPRKIEALTRYVQSNWGTLATGRMDRQRRWEKEAVKAYESGPDANVVWLHSIVPPPWRPMPNPYPATESALERGHVIYQQYCSGCHGLIGDGKGGGGLAQFSSKPAIYPPPLNFTTVRRHLEGGKYIGGIFYYQIMNGITGTAMPYFKSELQSEKIWDVSNYIAVRFVGYTDATIEPRGIEASYELPWQNPFIGKDGMPIVPPATTTRPK